MRERQLTLERPSVDQWGPLSPIDSPLSSSGGFRDIPSRVGSPIDEKRAFPWENEGLQPAIRLRSRSKWPVRSISAVVLSLLLLLVSRGLWPAHSSRATSKTAEAHAHFQPIPIVDALPTLDVITQPSKATIEVDEPPPEVPLSDVAEATPEKTDKIPMTRIEEIRAEVLPTIIPLEDQATAQIDLGDARSVTEMNHRVCGADSCHFLIIGAVREQESRAELHISQLASLAQRLNRTLVLPNVEGGRYSTCFARPFSLFHDIEGTAKAFGIRAIQFSDFEEYTKQSAELHRVSVQRLVISNMAKVDQPSVVVNAPMRFPECYGEAQLDLSTYHTSALETNKHLLRSNEDRVAFSDWIVETMSSPEYWQHVSVTDSGTSTAPDAYFVEWAVTQAIFPLQGGTHLQLPFHSRWGHLADELVKVMSPIIALHWRMEAVRLDVSYIPDYAMCAKAACEVLKRYGDRAKTVWFMTDYPLDNVEHSSTFSHVLSLHRDHAKAAKQGIDELLSCPHLAESTGQFDLITLDRLDLSVPLANGSSIPIKELDFGLDGIIDKMVAERADVYLVGEAEVCAHVSTYIEMVVAQRRKSGHVGDEAVAYFPTAGDRPY